VHLLFGSSTDYEEVERPRRFDRWISEEERAEV
jgi:hypothetical protein